MTETSGLLIATISLKGAKAHGWDYCNEYLIHRGRCLTDSEFRTLVNYGLANGYETPDTIPTWVVDAICDTTNREFDKYEDKETRLVSEQRVERLLRCYKGEELTDDIINDIIDNL